MLAIRTMWQWRPIGTPQSKGSAFSQGVARSGYKCSKVSRGTHTHEEVASCSFFHEEAFGAQPAVAIGHGLAAAESDCMHHGVAVKPADMASGVHNVTLSQC